jgi:hypothetical protein
VKTPTRDYLNLLSGTNVANRLETDRSCQTLSYLFTFDDTDSEAPAFYPLKLVQMTVPMPQISPLLLIPAQRRMRHQLALNADVSGLDSWSDLVHTANPGFRLCFFFTSSKPKAAGQGWTLL